MHSNTSPGGRMIRGFLCAYQLRNGATGTRQVAAFSSCDAVIVMLDWVGDRLQRLSVRPA